MSSRTEQSTVLISFSLPKRYVEKIRETFPRFKVLQSKDKAEALNLVKGAQILFAGFFSPEMFKAATKLRWIQTHLVGVESYLFPKVVESQVIVTNAGGVNSICVAEHAIGLMLSLSRKLYRFARDQSEHKWKTGDAELMNQMDELSGKTLGIIGLGRIGIEIAQRAKCFGMKVMAMTRTSQTRSPYIDKMIPSRDLNTLLTSSDFVVLQLPLTEETEGFIGEEQLRSMKKTSYLINTGRGKLIREDELVRALEEGWIAGAALDAFEHEPLPPTSPLWHMDNVIITPHVAGLTPRYLDRLVDIFCENLTRYAENKPLINVVDKRRGY